MGAGAETVGPFVGRAAELDRLARLIGLEDGTPGSGAVLLAGDAGVGKTRLLAELRRRAERSGWRTVTGHCLDFGDSAPPYLPFTEIFGRVAEASPALGASLVDHEPALDRLMPLRRVLAAPHAPPARMERSDLFEAVSAGLQRIAEATPLLVVIEDAHWADHSTREMLSFLFARPFPRPVAIVASYRGDDLHRRHPLRAAVGEWARLPGVTRVQLAALADADVRTLVRSLHAAPLPESSVRGIVARAEGNAFFVEELVAAADRTGTSLPTDLVDLLLVRVDRLDEPVRLVVRTASVAGRRVSHDLLAQVVEMDDATLESSLRTAVEANVLVATGADAYAFRHALLAEAIYDDLLPGERVRLHGAYTRVLAAHRSEGSAADLARHARAAHDVATGLRASIEAGDEAMGLAGPAEAAHHYEHALGFLADATAAGADLDPPVDPVGLAVRAGDASLAAGNAHRAVMLLQDQLRQLPGDAAAVDRARLLLALASAALQGETGVDPLRATTEAVRLVPSDPPTPLRAQIVNMHARSNADRRRDDEAARWAGMALDLGRRLHLPDIAADATTTLARVDERAGDPESSRLALEKAVVDAAEAGEAAAELRALFVLGSLHYTLGQLPEAASVCRTAVQRARAHGRPWAPYGLDARVLAGIVAYVGGRWDEVVRLVDVSDEAPPGLAEALLGAAGLAVAAGRGEHQAVDLLPSLRPWWERDGQVAILAAAAAIDLHGDRGHLDEAVAVHDDVVTCVAGLWDQPTFPARIRLAGVLLGQLCAATRTTASRDLGDLAGRGDELAGEARAAAAHGLRSGHPYGAESDAWLARVAAEQLRLHWLTGEVPPSDSDLVAAWERSTEAFGRFGHRFETARSEARLAAVLRSTGRADEAARYGAGARETASELGAAPLLDELRVGAPSAPAGRRSAPSRRDEALTGRETEVLALLAVGRSNREIGQQLYISGKTVSVHVSNLMAKLGASGRTEAVAIARRRGLVIPDEGGA